MVDYKRDGEVAWEKWAQWGCVRKVSSVRLREERDFSEVAWERRVRWGFVRKGEWERLDKKGHVRMLLGKQFLIILEGRWYVASVESQHWVWESFFQVVSCIVRIFVSFIFGGPQHGCNLLLILAGNLETYKFQVIQWVPTYVIFHLLLITAYFV